MTQDRFRSGNFLQQRGKTVRIPAGNHPGSSTETAPRTHHQWDPMLTPPDLNTRPVGSARPKPDRERWRHRGRLTENGYWTGLPGCDGLPRQSLCLEKVTVVV